MALAETIKSTRRLAYGMLSDPTLIFSRLKEISARSGRWNLTEEHEGKLLEFQSKLHSNLTLAFELHSSALWVVEAIDVRATRIVLSKLFRFGEESSLILLAHRLFTRYKFLANCFCEPGSPIRF